MKGLAVNLGQCGDSHLADKNEEEIDISLIGLDGIVGQTLFGKQIAKKERSCG